MEKGLQEFLENSVLSEDTKAALSEAWTRKLSEARAEEAFNLRQEFAAKFEQDKANIVEAMNAMITDVLTEQAKEVASEKKRLVAESARIANESKAKDDENHQKAAKTIKTLESFVAETLKAEISEMRDELNEQRRQLSEDKAEYERKINENKAASRDRLKMLESFVTKAVSSEMTELSEDRKALVETRVKLQSENRAKMAETRRLFIERASKLVESTIETRLNAEMGQLRADLKEARESRFGRAIFEAYQNEFLNSGLSNGTRLKATEQKLAEATKALNEAREASKKVEILAESNKRDAMIAREKLMREKTLNSLLNPLNRETRRVMGELLEGVKTENLKAAFDKNLPFVLNERSSNPSSQGRRVLAESRSPKTISEHTGNRNSRLTESSTAEDAVSQMEIADIKRKAGIK